MRPLPKSLDRARVRRAMVDFARKHGILAERDDATEESDDAALDDLLQLTAFAQGRDADRPVIVEIAKPFSTQPVSEHGALRMAVIRSAFTLTASSVEEACKAGRYRSLAMTALEEACMWAIKSITHEPID